MAGRLGQKGQSSGGGSGAARVAGNLKRVAGAVIARRNCASAAACALEALIAVPLSFSAIACPANRSSLCKVIIAIESNVAGLRGPVKSKAAAAT
jgi:hypothetical protein